MSYKKRLSVIFTILLALIFPFSSSYALTDEMLDKFAANNIMFYDPDDACSNPTRLSGRCGGEIESTGNVDRTKEAVAKYGEVAINLQLEYGVPWELVFGQFAAESSVGTAGVAVDIYNEADGYNWLGHHGPSPSNGACPTAVGKYSADYSWGPNLHDHCFRVYRSIADMIGGHMFDFLRNGNYDEMLRNASADNWNLDAAGTIYVCMYVQGLSMSDCDTSRAQGYWGTVKQYMGYADEVAAEKGWPTGEEVAKNNNLPVGGRHTELGNITTGVPNHSLHYDCNGNTVSNGTSSASASWSEGWLSGNLQGYTKEEATSGFSADFASTPDKITISVTNSDNSSDGSLLDLHAGSSNVPHFTVDPVNNKISQHGPITKVGSNESNGIEIAIVGYASNSPEAEWDISSYTSTSYAILAKLLLMINSQTNISLTSGVQSPDLDATAISTIQKAVSELQASLNDPCSSGISGVTGDVAKFQEWVLKLALPHHISSGQPGALTPTDTYRQIVASGEYYIGDTTHPGADCGGFVNIIMHVSGWDENYGGSHYGNGQTAHALTWLSDPANGWTEVTSSIHSNDDMMPGDVLDVDQESPKRHHTLVYVGHIPGFGNENTVMASASQATRMPMADAVTDIMYYINLNYHIFRKVK
jgi:hypothetical protein